MHPILEKLNAYLASATEEQLKADWEELKQYNVSGPKMRDVLEASMQRIEFNKIDYSYVQDTSFSVEYDMTVEFNLAA